MHNQESVFNAAVENIEGQIVTVSEVIDTSMCEDSISPHVVRIILDELMKEGFVQQEAKFSSVRLHVLPKCCSMYSFANGLPLLESLEAFSWVTLCAIPQWGEIEDCGICA